MRGRLAADAVPRLSPRQPLVAAIAESDTMRLALIVTLTLCCLAADGRPVRRKLNFNMFVLQPHKGGTPDRFLVSTDGISRFGPILEYFVQRVQGMMSVKVPHNHQAAIDVPMVHNRIPIADTSENEIDGVQQVNAPGVVVRPSQTKPGTYEVEINVVVDDGQPEDRKIPK